MIIIRMTGGLGNQMFQYALYLKLKSMGRDVKFDDKTEYELSNARPIMLWAFGIDYPKASKEEINQMTDGFLYLSHRIRRKIFGRKSLEYQENSCNYDGQILKKEQAYLTGYFQSEKYFKEIESDVREAFTFHPSIFENIDADLKKKINAYEKEIEENLSVSIHIRRGDYLENSEVYGGNCTAEYYEKAIHIIKDKFPQTVFFVFSNDDAWAQEWCKEQEKEQGLRFVPVTDTPEELGYLDMYLMSKCKHHIIANSSFSWWGAWLNASPDKMVLAPARWFNNQTCYDIYTKEMMKISPEGTIVEDDTK